MSNSNLEGVAIDERCPKCFGRMLENSEENKWCSNDECGYDPQQLDEEISK